jgi:hypothetical protein
MLFLFLIAFAAIVLRWISLERWRVGILEQGAENSVEPSVTPNALPTATKPPVIGGKIETSKLFSGITVHSTLEPTQGADATTERNDPDSYVLDFKLRMRVPTPNKSLEELAKVNPKLPEVLPGLAAMMQGDAVSPLYHDLYETKLRQLRDNLMHLDQLLSRHNFYDTQTVLNLRHPESKRRAVLLQADMDVDADGSDADRLPAGSGVSLNFRPFTSYKWNKKTPATNPYQAPSEERLKRLQAELASGNASPERKRDLQNAIRQTRDDIETMKKFSFLIGAADPYVVWPGGFSRGDGAKIGDYCVVIFDDKLYPAIIGDIGPADKTGEASLRIAKEINPAATPMNRPVNDLKVTYLAFPGTADQPWGPPDYNKLSVRCESLVKEIGGATVPLHHWENIIPTPTPTPTPSPTITPTTSPSFPTPTPTQTAPVSPAFAFPTSTPTP